MKLKKSVSDYDWCGICLVEDCRLSSPMMTKSRNVLTGEIIEECYCVKERKESREPSDENSQLSFLELF